MFSLKGITEMKRSDPRLRRKDLHDYYFHSLRSLRSLRLIKIPCILRLLVFFSS